MHRISFAKKFNGVIKRQLKLFIVLLSIVGPGIITAVADSDAGSLATYIVAASLYGYAAQFLIIPLTVLLGLTQEVGARIAIVSRRGLADLIRDRFGIRWAIITFTLLFIANQAVVVQNVLGIKASLQLLNLPYHAFLPLIILLIWLLFLKGNFRTILKGVLVVTLFYILYVFSAFHSNPDWFAAFKNTFWPQDIESFDPRFLYILLAILGTTINAWGQFFIQSFIKDKGLDVINLKHSKIMVYAGALITSLFILMIIIAVSGTLHKNGIVEINASVAARALSPIVGQAAFLVFAVGLFIASVMGSLIVPLSTAYAFSEFFGFERSLDKSFSQNRKFYGFLIIQLFLGLFVALIPSLSLFQITLAVGFFNGALLPGILYYLIRFSNDPGIMGKYVNTRTENYILLGSALVVLIGVIITIGGSIFIQ